MKNKMKSALLITVLLALIALSAVAVTWALSSYSEMGKRENVFTPDDTVKLAIAEPWWDYLNENRRYEHTSGGTVTENLTEDGADVPSDYPSGETLTALGLSSPVQGEELAASYLPDMMIPKNPKLYNMYTRSSGDDDNTGAEYVAMTVSYRLLIPAQVISQNNIFTRLSGSTVSGYYWTPLSDFSSFNTYTDDNGTPSDTSDDRVFLDVDLTYAQFNSLAKVYSSTSDAGFHTGTGAADWTAFEPSSGFADGSAFYYNGVVYARGSGHLDSTYTNPTAPLFSYVRINSFDGTAGQGSRVTLPDADSLSATSSVKYELTVPDKNGNSVTLYLNTLPKFEIGLKGFAIDANVSEFKSNGVISDLAGLNGTARSNALDALKALMDKANS